MKNFKNFYAGVSLILMMMMTLTLSAQNQNQIIQDYEVTEPGTVFTTPEKDKYQQHLQSGMASFVESLKPFYQKGMTYNGFLTNLKGENATFEMPKEGEALLQKGFSYLSKGASFKQIANNPEVKELATAALYVNDKNTNSNLQKSFVDGNASLFGLSQNVITSKATIDAKSEGKCRWWQLACHLNQIFGEVNGARISSALAGLLEYFINSVADNIRPDNSVNGN